LTSALDREQRLGGQAEGIPGARIPPESSMKNDLAPAAMTVKLWARGLPAWLALGGRPQLDEAAG